MFAPICNSQRLRRQVPGTLRLESGMGLWIDLQFIAIMGRGDPWALNAVLDGSQPASIPGRGSRAGRGYDLKSNSAGPPISQVDLLGRDFSRFRSGRMEFHLPMNSMRCLQFLDHPVTGVVQHGSQSAFQISSLDKRLSSETLPHPGDETLFVDPGIVQL